MGRPVEKLEKLDEHDALDKLDAIDNFGKLDELDKIDPQDQLDKSVDLQFLRRILNAPKSTLKEMLFLGTGCVPFSKSLEKGE